MLGKGFFNVKPFNPNPYPDPVIVNLSGAQKFEEDTVFLPGRYSVLVKAGGSFAFENPFGQSGKIQQIITITQPFIIRAYSGSKGTNSMAGTNPYQGAFKVNPIQGDVPSVNHIFGNCGGCSKGYGGVAEGYGSGNSLGDGVRYSLSSSPNTFYSCGAGSCLHIMPIGGTFGDDYLFAFHTTAAPAHLMAFCQTGGGSAYGGSASGGASSTGAQGLHAQYGFSVGNTPYGNGGERSYSDTGLLAYGLGHEGTGIGHGYTGFIGAAAWFNGTIWQQSDVLSNKGEDGGITVTYLGPLNEEVYYAWGSNPSVKEPRVFTKNLNPQVGDQAWFFDFDNARTSYDIKDATQVTIQSSGTGVAPIVWVDNTGFYAIGTLGPATYTLNRMSNDDIIIKW